MRRHASILLFLLLCVAPGTSVAKRVVRFDVDGIPVRLVQNRDFDYVTLSLIVRSGSLADPKGKEGLANLTAQMLRRGAGKLDQAGFEDALDYLGSKLEISVGYESTSIGGDSLGRNLDAFLQLVSTMLGAPRFEAAQIEKQKRLIVAQIDAIRENDATLGAQFFRRALFADHLLGRPTLGTPRSVRTLRQEDVKAYFRQAFVRNNLIVGFSG
ncbi:MAG: insulinase family protein, partial [Myxococcales bacterium]|nr:insulinase family protein [Myxococcales bacterium]